MADDGNGSSSNGQAQAQRYLRSIDDHAGKVPWLDSGPSGLLSLVIVEE